MSTESHTIPDDTASRVARLINAAEDMRQQAADDLKQIYADLREELRALGWDGKHVSAEVAALKGAIAEIRLDDEKKAKREERGERIDDYVSLLTRARARTRGDDRRSDAGLNIITKHTEITASDGASPAVSPLAGSARDEESAVSNSPETATECAAPERDAAAGDGAISAVNARAGLENAVGVEPSSSAPTQKSKLRPYCRNPGEACGGYGSKHCHACLIALEEEEAA